MSRYSNVVEMPELRTRVCGRPAQDRAGTEGIIVKFTEGGEVVLFSAGGRMYAAPLASVGLLPPSVMSRVVNGGSF